MDPQPSSAGSRPPLVILGASCRFAAESAARAGWAVHAADLFNDTDLSAAAASTRRALRYPDDLVDAAAAFPAAPWCYTGALENHLHVVERVAAVRMLAGNGIAAVRRVRDPAECAAVVRLAGLRSPDTFTSPLQVPTDGSFLRKPAASAGGRGIAPWHGPAASDPPGSVWQRRIAGEPWSGVLSLDAGSARLLGLSRQLVGTSWCRAAPFAYTGSVAIRRADIPPTIHDQFSALASALAGPAGLRGVVGVDAIVDPGGRVTVIEINPRPTASAELVERVSGESIMAVHLAAFRLRSPSVPEPRPDDDAIWAKAILFAAVPVAIDEGLIDRLHALAAPWTATDGHRAIADIPRVGQVLRPGAPVLTVFARGETPDAGVAALRHRIDAVKAVTG